MWRRILAYILMGLGLLTITFFRRYTGELIPYPFLFWVIGVVLFIGGLLFLRLTPSTNEINDQKQLTAIIAALKAGGEKMQVDLAHCDLKEHSYTEEQDRYGHDNEALTLDLERQIQGWNALGGDSILNVEQVNVRQTVLIYQYQNDRTGKNKKIYKQSNP